MLEEIDGFFFSLYLSKENGYSFQGFQFLPQRAYKLLYSAILASSEL